MQLSILIDTNSILIRYAMAQKESNYGGLKYFFRLIITLIKKYPHSRFFMTSDCSRHNNFRRNIDPQYKLNRKPLPNLVSLQRQKLSSILNSHNIELIKNESHEADDIIASLANILPGKKIVISSDKDLLQLINQNVCIYNPFKNSKIFTDIEVQKSYGITAKQLKLYLSIVGDSADNIKGVYGLGPKKTVELINSLDQTIIDLIYDDPKEILNYIPKKFRKYDFSNLSTSMSLVDLVYDLFHKDNISRGSVLSQEQVNNMIASIQNLEEPPMDLDIWSDMGDISIEDF